MIIIVYVYHCIILTILKDKFQINVSENQNQMQTYWKNEKK